MPNKVSSRPPELSPEILTTNRRAVLRGFSLVGLAASSAVALTVPAAANEPPANNQGLQYRETDHIRNYYALARR